MDRVLVATIGKTFGVQGFLKLHLHTDFSEQFEIKKIWDSSSGKLEIDRYIADRGLVRFRGFETREDAKRLTNTKLYISADESREVCQLGEGEFFWFDILGLDVFEEGTRLGKVKEIERITNIDYLHIETDRDFVDRGLPKLFLIPYIDRYIVDVQLDERKIVVQGGIDILEAS
ncbi:MAG TPA: 16S rRNA processing protein RimM [Campylobacterales bacterium]|nr:16S rRNA processing protein RimM [Campylobacterales bacterium]